MARKVQTDEYVKKKAVKLVVSHIQKKLEDFNNEKDVLENWFDQMDELLGSEEFDLHKYHDMRRRLNDLIDCIYDVDLRYKLRDSWISLGKALDKKAKKY